MKNVKLIAVLAVALVALMIVPAFAASSTVVKDQEITVTLTFTGAKDGSGVSGALNYDATKLTYVDGSYSASDSGMGYFNAANGNYVAGYAEAPESFTVTLKFKATEDGTYDITLGDYDLDGTGTGAIVVAGGTTPTPTPTATTTGTVKTYNNGDGSYSWVYGNTAAATSTTKSTSSVPATGDNSSMMWIYIALATLGLAGLGAVVAKKVFAK